MPRPTYVASKLAEAVFILATGTESLQTRLASAYVGALLRVQPEDLEHQEDRALFETISAAFQVFASPTEGSARTSMGVLDDTAAIALAKDILELHDRHFPL